MRVSNTVSAVSLLAFASASISHAPTATLAHATALALPKSSRPDVLHFSSVFVFPAVTSQILQSSSSPALAHGNSPETQKDIDCASLKDEISRFNCKIEHSSEFRDKYNAIVNNLGPSIRQEWSRNPSELIRQLATGNVGDWFRELHPKVQDYWRSIWKVDFSVSWSSRINPMHVTTGTEVRPFPTQKLDSILGDWQISEASSVHGHAIIYMTMAVLAAAVGIAAVMP